ncbi:MAG: ribosome recycling factor [bacterium]|nr:ribosome recycling factor [bacterium]
MADQRIQSFIAQTAKTFEHLHSEYSRLQTGRANASVVEHVLVDAYGQKQEIRAVAGISVDDARTIVIQPWDKAILKEIDAALQVLDLGTSPTNDGNVIRIVLPPMTEERRIQMTKIVHQIAEEARISIRQQRQSVSDDVKKTETDEDVRYTLLEELDKETKIANEKIEVSMKKKEEEVMTV